MKTELLIIGAGAAGIAAAVSAWNAGCRDVLLTDRRSLPGGILPQCTHKGFGLAQYGSELTGQEYVRRLVRQLDDTGILLALRTAVLELHRDKTALLSDRNGLTEVCFEQMILASGCREKSIGSLGLAGSRPSGVFTAGQAQEMMNLRGQDPGDDIVILGSGDLGMILAGQFVLAGKKLIAIIEKEHLFGGMPRNYHRYIEPYNIPIIYRTTITEIHSSCGTISGVTLRHLDDGNETFLPCRTLITALGLIPERNLLQGLGNPDWLFLAGNCNRVHTLVDSAVSEATVTGRKAARMCSV